MKKKFTRILGVALPLVMVFTLAITLLPASTPDTAEAAVGKLRFGNIPMPKIGVDGGYVLTPNVDIGAIAVTPGGSVMFAADASSLSDTTTNTGAAWSSTNTTLTVASTAGFRTSGVVSIGEELIFYKWTTATTLTGCTRAYADTTASSTANNTAVTEVSMLYKSTDGGWTFAEQAGFLTAVASGNASSMDATAIVAIGASPDYSTDSTVYVATQKNVYESTDSALKFRAIGISGTDWNAAENITDMDVTLDSRGRLSLIVGTTRASNLGEVYVLCPTTTGSTWQAQTISTTRNVLAVAFSPNFASDEGIFAVTANTTVGTITEINTAFGYTKDGGGWAASIGDGEFLDTNGDSISTTSRARIAFPDDFDVDSITSNIAFVGLMAGPSIGDNDTEKGDVYRVTFQPTMSSTVDLNVRGLISTLRTATNIYSIDVSGEAEAATIIVGTNFWSTGVTNYYWSAYYSTDSGVTWSTARSKSPTGGTATRDSDAILIAGANAGTNVVMAPDFATSGVAYAGTRGAETSGLSRTTDGGKSWNQISLIDYGDTTTAIYDPYVNGVATYTPYYILTKVLADVMYGQTQTLRLMTKVPTGLGVSGVSAETYKQPAIWSTTNGGGNYERIFSDANPTVSRTLTSFWITGDTMFTYDYSLGRLWRSSDMGTTWPRTVMAKKASVKYLHIVDPTTIYTIYDGGEFWYTENLGRPWVQLDEDGVLTGTPLEMDMLGDMILITTATKVCISFDKGVTFSKLGLNNPGTGAYLTTLVDPDYAENHYIYTTTGYVGVAGGVEKIEVNEDDPDSTEWRRIDDNDTTCAGWETVMATGMMNLFGVTYVFDFTTANATAGGLWRSVNASSDPDGTSPPAFAKFGRGLPTGHMYKSALTAAVYPNTPFLQKIRLLTYGYTPYGMAAADDYYLSLYAMGDTLSSGVTLIEPADGIEDAGMALSTTDLTRDIILSWEAVPGATWYLWLVCNDPYADSVAQSGTTEGQEVRVEDLIPGKTYYWLVRVNTPIRTPWSEVRSFTIGAVEPAVVGVPFDIITPERGATGVSIQPTFIWAEVEGATSYELVVAEDPTFAIIDWSRTSANTFYKAEEALAYDSTYAWKVRAAPDGPWATGVFTTEAVPPEPVAPTVIEPTEPADIIVQVPAAEPAIPTYLLWTIIGIGAVLFIALIVLIVRTRRVT